MRLLLIEDDHELANALLQSLAQSGHASDVAGSGKAALASSAATAYDLVILDLGLPDMDGLDLLAQLRRRGLLAPVLILTARDGVHDRIRGLDSGADDYLAKPFALGELEARMRALLRRGAVGEDLVEFGPLQFDANAREFSVHGRRLDLTARELGVLEALMRRPGRVVGKQNLFESIYAWDADAGPSAIEVHVSRLRRKLEACDSGVAIRALRGLGYRLEHD